MVRDVSRGVALPPARSAANKTRAKPARRILSDSEDEASDEQQASVASTSGSDSYGEASPRLSKPSKSVSAVVKGKRPAQAALGKRAPLEPVSLNRPPSRLETATRLPSISVSHTNGNVSSPQGVAKGKKRLSGRPSLSAQRRVSTAAGSSQADPTEASTSQVGSPSGSSAAIGMGQAPVHRVGALAAAAARRVASNVGSADTGPPLPSISVEVMNTNYEEWMKLATDNKINSSNTWAFALIDYFHDMSLLRNGPGDSSINFQKASCTLEGCIKIWTSRVDSVATETGKLLSGLADDASPSSLADQDDEAEEGDDQEGEGTNRRRKRAKRIAPTLADSYDKLKVKSFDLEFTVDPLFKKTSADFDEGGAAGILMNHLGCDEKLRVVFDSGDAAVDDQEQDESSEAAGKPHAEPSLQLDLTDLFSLLPPDLTDQGEFAGMSICPSMAAFKFSADDSLFDLSALKTALGANPSDALQSMAADLTSERGASLGPTMDFFDDYDGGGGGMSGPEGGADENDDGAHTSRANSQGPLEAFDPRTAPNERQVMLAMNERQGNNGDEMFDYFDHAFAKNWAGPEHWKMRRAPPPKRVVIADGEAKTKKDKASSLIDFFSPAPIASKKLFETSSASTTLPATRRKSKKTAARSRDDHTLPDDMQFNSRQLLRLFLKPRAEVTMRRHGSRIATVVTAAQKDTEEIDSDYWAKQASLNNAAQVGDDFDDADQGMPALPFESQFFHEPGYEPDEFDDLPMGMGDGAEGEIGADASIKEQGGDDLLAATQHEVKRVRPEFVEYSKKAKRVDVKKLKENIWKELNILPPLEAAPVGTVQPARTFDNVITGLRKTYPKDKMEEISTSFCFICLLHLANENGLNITSVKDDDDDEQLDDFAGNPDPTDAIIGGLQSLRISSQV